MLIWPKNQRKVRYRTFQLRDRLQDELREGALGALAGGAGPLLLRRRVVVPTFILAFFSEGKLLANVWQTLRGPFSAVSKPILRVNTRWKALDETYKIRILLHRSDLNISPNVRRFFWRFQIQNR